MRAFIALELPLDIKNALDKIQDKLKITLPGINWIKPSNLHLSLKFLGEISVKQSGDIQQIITEITKTILPFEIKLETLGVFPDCRQAHIIWVGTNQPPPELKQLTDQLETKLLEFGLAEEQHPFLAHITLGRIKHPIIALDLEKTLEGLKKEIAQMNFGFNSRGITLFQSVLGPNGPTYTILKEAAF
jgi:RNA 2',3'-cyclic 3'-phosphodiesterase